MFFLSMAFAQDPIHPEPIVKFDQDWLVWVGTNPPPEWPLIDTPSSKSGLYKIPSENRSYPDRLLSYSASELTRQNQWHAYLKAPYSLYTREIFEEKLPEREKQIKKRQKYGKRPYSRTAFIQPNSQPLRQLYFAKSFVVDDPSEWASLQGEAKFHRGMQIFLNGTEIILHDLPETGHNSLAEIEQEVPDYMQLDIGVSDRWQKAWMGVDSSLLKQGENIISVSVHRLPEAGNPDIYFDFLLSGYREFDFTKVPYLMHPSSDGITVSWEVSKKATCEVFLLESDNSVVIPFASSQNQNFHEVRIEQLKPNHQYQYQVSCTSDDQVIQSEAHHFSTVVEDDTDFTFLLYGDSRSHPDIHEDLATLMRKDVLEYNIPFVVHTGDFVTYGYDWTLWQEDFFAPTRNLLSLTALLPAIGNHEVRQPIYYQYMDAPHNESWYHKRYGHADFIALNSHISLKPDTEQMQWFAKKLEELQDSTARWKIVFFHHPPFSCTPDRKPGYDPVRRHVVPLLEKYDVDLVLLGHDHLYGRTPKINGVMYLTSGGGGAGLYNGRTDANNETCIEKHHYVRMDVSQETLSWVGIDREGKILETYTLTKEPEDQN